ncbi:MarR family winged helix-turn-helix transcriptional regulator [Kribbella sp. NPDC051587]|uniref:MarR family winged helix-turn-helix transcriptional regulator n=1 Tax=Kribbella sp. NPDC051587 TaxID=3364119 RepID=UPI00378B36EC
MNPRPRPQMEWRATTPPYRSSHSPEAQATWTRSGAGRPVLRELGLTSAEYDVIVALRREGAPYRQKPSDLSRTSNVINQLVRRGYVDREPDPEDGRGTQIRLTADGVKAAEEAVVASSAAQHKVWDGYPDETVRQAIAVLRTLQGLDT